MQHFDQEKTLCFIELMFKQDKSVIVLKVTLCFTSERTDGQNRTRPEHVSDVPQQCFINSHDPALLIILLCFDRLCDV